MLVYRIARSIHAEDLSGTGAALFGGRWNPTGLPLLYTASSISLAYLEHLVHNIHLLNTQPMALVTIQVPADATRTTLKEENLPHDWNEKTYTPQSTQKIGGAFIAENKHPLLEVPSAIVPEESNVLLNPLHPLHSQLKIVDKVDPFTVDDRFSK